jgi:DNA-binding NarL/FixJ family response regulator
LITDLGMPTSGGASYQGGFEVVKRLWKMGLRPPVLMMAESLDPSLRARAKQMGVASFVFKPGLAKLDSRQFEADLRAFASKLIQDVLPRLALWRRGGLATRKCQARAGGAAGAAQPPKTSRETSR